MYDVLRPGIVEESLPLPKRLRAGRPEARGFCGGTDLERPPDRTGRDSPVAPKFRGQAAKDVEHCTSYFGNFT